MKTSVISIIAFIAFVTIWGAAFAQTFEIVAQENDPAPGTGTDFSQLDREPTINDRGEIAFVGDINVSDRNLWVVQGDGTNLLVAEGMAAPGTGGTFGEPSSAEDWIQYGDGGHIGFFNRIQDVPSTNSESLWFGCPTNLQLIAREGDPAAGASGDIHGNGNFDDIAINERGQIAFHHEAPEGNDGIWAGEMTNIQLIIRVGDPAPGLGGDLTFIDDAPALSPGGEVFFRGRTSAGFTDALWIATSTGMSLVALEGNGAPDLPGVSYRDFEVFDYYEGESVFYQANLTGPGIGATNDFAWFYGDPASPKLFVQEGTSVPDAGAGATLSILAQTEWMANRQGNQAFRIMLKNEGGIGNTNDAVFYWAPHANGAPTNWLKIFQEGDTAPETGGARFQTFGDFTLNELGQVAFRTDLQGPEIGITNDEAIFLWDPGNESLSLVAREGDPIILNGNTQTIHSVDMRNNDGTAGPPSGRSGALNAFGQCVFWMTGDGFEDIVVKAQLSASYDTWVASQHIPLATRGAGDDANGDGIPNLIDYYLGTSVHELNSNFPTLVRHESTNLMFSYSSPVYVTGVTEQIEISTNLATAAWVPGPALSITGTTLTLNQFSATLPADTDVLFVRLLLSLD